MVDLLIITEEVFNLSFRHDDADSGERIRVHKVLRLDVGAIQDVVQVFDNQVSFFQGNIVQIILGFLKHLLLLTDIVVNCSCFGGEDLQQFSEVAARESVVVPLEVLYVLRKALRRVLGQNLELCGGVCAFSQISIGTFDFLENAFDICFHLEHLFIRSNQRFDVTELELAHFNFDLVAIRGQWQDFLVNLLPGGIACAINVLCTH